MDPVTIGLIGCGNISAAYLRAAPLFPELRSAALADLDESSARARAEEFGLRAAMSRCSLNITSTSAPERSWRGEIAEGNPSERRTEAVPERNHVGEPWRSPCPQPAAWDYS